MVMQDDLSTPDVGVLSRCRHQNVPLGVGTASVTALHIKRLLIFDSQDSKEGVNVATLLDKSKFMLVVVYV